MDISILHQLFLKSSGVTTDTRRIESGQIFFALKGPNFNGNLYANDAINSGCTYVVIDEDIEYTHDKSRYIKVEDVLQCLQELSNYHRYYLDIPIIGITGSNGKTTTKELLSAVLATKYIVKSTRGNLNNHIGVPLTLLSFDEATEIGIVEMGTNDFGEIEFLCQIAAPTHGLITSIGKAHLEKLIDEKGVLKEKSSLFTFLKENEGIIFLNKDSELLVSLGLSGQSIINYNSLITADLKISVSSSFPNLSLVLIEGAESKAVEIDLYGIYNVQNVSAAIAVGRYFNIGLNDIYNGLANFVNADNRCEIIQVKSNTVYLDAYNANPSSMRAAVCEFSEFKKENKILVLGEMKELGITKYEEHDQLLNLAIEKDFDFIIAIGDLYPSYSRDKLFQCSTVTESQEIFDSIINNGSSHIYIKGSRSSRLESLLN